MGQASTNRIRAIFTPDGSSDVVTRRDSTGSGAMPSLSNSNQMGASAGAMTSTMMAAPPPLMFKSVPRAVCSDPFVEPGQFRPILADGETLPETTFVMVLKDRVE